MHAYRQWKERIIENNKLANLHLNKKTATVAVIYAINMQNNFLSGVRPQSDTCKNWLGSHPRLTALLTVLFGISFFFNCRVCCHHGYRKLTVWSSKKKFTTVSGRGKYKICHIGYIVLLCFHPFFPLGYWG